MKIKMKFLGNLFQPRNEKLHLNLNFRFLRLSLTIATFHHDQKIKIKVEKKATTIKSFKQQKILCDKSLLVNLNNLNH